METILDSQRPFICSAVAETDNATMVQLLYTGPEPWTTFHIPCTAGAEPGDHDCDMEGGNPGPHSGRPPY
jgi:hypothetical protein